MKTLHSLKGKEFSLNGLVEVTGELLSGTKEGADGRISETVNIRLIRFYQTTGLLDKPLRYEGRNAVYGFRHVLQILAVRQLQHEGYPLKTIQQGLAGISSNELEAKVSQFFSDVQFPISLQGALPDSGQKLKAEELCKGLIVVIDENVLPGSADLLERFRKVLKPVKN